MASSSGVELPVHYKGMALSCSFRADLIVKGRVLVELKSVERLRPIHEAQVLSYMRLAGLGVGLLVNFNVPLLRDGVRRFVN